MLAEEARTFGTVGVNVVGGDGEFGATVVAAHGLVALSEKDARAFVAGGNAHGGGMGRRCWRCARRWRRRARCVWLLANTKRHTCARDSRRDAFRFAAAAIGYRDSDHNKVY